MLVKWFCLEPKFRIWTAKRKCCKNSMILNNIIFIFHLNFLEQWTIFQIFETDYMIFLKIKNAFLLFFLTSAPLSLCNTVHAASIFLSYNESIPFWLCFSALAEVTWHDMGPSNLFGRWSKNKVSSVSYGKGRHVWHGREEWPPLWTLDQAEQCSTQRACSQDRNGTRRHVTGVQAGETTNDSLPLYWTQKGYLSWV